eukprot:gnl/Spiro4/7263_TR3799_c0_g1_i1.p2 gnl/Spiro4/7263_TR3799_c0_g1~~gnl/Spiro4/7263_TR3799_c0_g1_i1.p2  ORF type:complete len:234 (-),score=56.13 gnl/Spiro4/7263_TR3799_c0_g1_i1:33-734(-)
MATDVLNVYREVIKDVINSMRAEFINEGVDEEVLDTMQNTWENKLMATNALFTEENDYGQPSCAYVVTDDLYNTQPFSNTTTFFSGPPAALAQGLQLPFPHSTTGQQGATRLPPPPTNVGYLYTQGSFVGDAPQPPIPQTDGLSDTEDSTRVTQPPPPPAVDSRDGLDDSDLNSEDEDEQQEEGEQDCGDYILAQFDKVKRVKTKWRCTLKDGMMNLGGRDYLFHKATGEFEW